MNEPYRELASLCDQSLKGDQTAHRLLLTRFMPIIRAFVRGQLSRNRFEHLTEDVVQDTLMAIHLKLHTYETGSNPLPWVYTIAKYKMIDQLRRHKMNLSSIDDPHYIESSDMTEDYDERDTNFDLSNLLNRLEPPQGDIIRALRVNGVSISELAKQYNYSESNIKIIVHRGIRKLNEFVRKDIQS